MADLSKISDEDLKKLYESHSDHANKFYEMSDEDLKNKYNSMNPTKGSSLAQTFKPPLPVGLDMISGFMSHAGQNPQEKEMIRNLPQKAYGEEPGIVSAIGQGIGEMGPLGLSGAGAAKGISGALGRIGGTAGIGAASNPQDRIAGAESGALAGTVGEALPGVFKTMAHLAEKIQPLQFAKEKIADIANKYRETQERQKQVYADAFKDLGNKKVTTDPMVKMGQHDPVAYLGFNKVNLSPEAKDLYDVFTKDATAKNLHNLQSQVYKDSISYRDNPNKTNSYEKAKQIRSGLVEKLKDFLSQDPKALAAYQEGANITKNEIKPFESTKTLRQIITGKIDELKPQKLATTIQNGLQSLKTNTPQDHYLRQALAEIKPKIAVGKALKDILPENLRKWSPKFADIAQYPALVNALKGLNLGGYQPLKTAATGKFLEQ